MKCFYHGDADGRCAAHLISISVDNRKEKRREDYIEVNYDKPFPFDVIERGERVYILDYSLEKPEDMDKLLEITEDVVWIDHHESTLVRYKDYPKKIKGIREVGTAGCVLTSMWLTGNRNPEDVPMFVRYIGDRDVWAWEFGDDTQYFYDGIMTLDLHPLSDNWISVYTEMEKMMKIGVNIGSYKERWNCEYIEKYGYEGTFEGLDAMFCNVAGADSKLFGDYMYSKDLCIMYVYNGEQYIVSLYSTKINVAEIAMRYGGGGHKEASGFQCKELPWVKK